MKTRNLIFAICLLLFTSCVVKSLHPFFTEKTSFFDENFIGEWTDNKGATWSIIPFHKEVFKNNSTKMFNNGQEYIIDTHPEKESLEKFNKYKNSLYIRRTSKEKEVTYIATAFKINNQKFLDFLPLSHKIDTDKLLESHSIYTHSLVKYDVQKKGEIEIRWLDIEKIEALFKEKKIKIKHEKIGLINENYLLTAKSEELQKFIKKYMASNDSEKWNTSTKFTLNKINGSD